MPTPLEEKEGELALRHQAILRLNEKRQAEGLSDDEYKDFQRYNQEARGLGEEVLREREIEDAALASRKALNELGTARRPGLFPGGAEQKAPDTPATNPTEQVFKSLAAHPDFAMFQKSASKVRIELPDVDLKTTMTTATGWAPETHRNGQLVAYPLRRPTVVDYIPQDNTDLAATSYMQETTFTNGAAAVAEGAAKPESAFAYTPVTVPVEAIATILPITRQQLRFVAGLQAIVSGRLMTAVALKEEDEVLNGDGTSPRLTGILTRTGLQTTAVGAAPDDRLTALLRAINLIRTVAYKEPSLIVVHPNDWMDFLNARDADGNYLFGGPQGVTPNQLWGIPVVPTTAMTQNTLLVGDFRGSAHISRAMGMAVETGYVNDDFSRNKVTLLCETWLSLEVLQPGAFATVTAV